MPTDIESAVAEDLRSAAASYAIALDAMRVDVAASKTRPATSRNTVRP